MIHFQAYFMETKKLNVIKISLLNKQNVTIIIKRRAIKNSFIGVNIVNCIPTFLCTLGTDRLINRYHLLHVIFECSVTDD